MSMTPVTGAPRSAMPPGPVMVDVQGFELTEHERERLQHPSVGGVILFTRNFSDRSQLTALCTAIRDARDEPLLIAVDHEGGRVQRFRATALLPCMRVEIWNTHPQEALQAATAVGYILAAELRACGVDLSFTPVLDLDYGVSQELAIAPSIVIRLLSLHWHVHWRKGLPRLAWLPVGNTFPAMAPSKPIRITPSQWTNVRWKKSWPKMLRHMGG